LPTFIIITIAQYFFEVNCNSSRTTLRTALGLVYDFELSLWGWTTVVRQGGHNGTSTSDNTSPYSRFANLKTYPSVGPLPLIFNKTWKIYQRANISIIQPTQTIQRHFPHTLQALALQPQQLTTQTERNMDRFLKKTVE
jgi:hypothetical protein